MTLGVIACFAEFGSDEYWSGMVLSFVGGFIGGSGSHYLGYNIVDWRSWGRS